MKKSISKKLSLILAAIMLLAILGGCAASGNKSGENENTASSTVETAGSATEESTAEGSTTDEDTAPSEDAVTIRLGGLTGPTAMGMVKLLDDADNNKTQNKYEFTLAGSADELTPKFLQGDLDIIAAPANLGSILYNNSNGAVKMLAVNTLGVVYIVEKGTEEVKSLEDLRGKTIYATGKGAVPEYALTYLLSQAGMDIEKDVKVEWKSEPTEVVSLMASQDSAVAMLPQPYVTVAQTKLDGLRVAVDLTEVWDSLDNGSKFITAGLFVRKEFAEKYPQQLVKFLDEYKASTEYVNSNVSEASQLIEKYGIVKAAIAEKALPDCNIVYIDGEDMSKAVKGYYEVLFGLNPKSVGGKLPDDDFYYEK